MKAQHVPELRFPGFEGEWVEKRLGDITTKVNSGKTPLGGEKAYTIEGVLFIRSQNVLEDVLSLESSTYIPHEINSTMQNSVVKPRDILLNITGASLGRSCVVPDDFTIGNVNQHVCIVRLDKQNEPYFVQPIFSSQQGQDVFQSLQTGSGREGLNFHSIKQVPLILPSLPEQQKIAAFLTAIDEKLQTLRKAKNLLEAYKKGVMQQIFSQELRFKDADGKDFGDWEEKRLGELYSFKVTNSFSRDNLNYSKGEVRNIHYGDIHTKFQPHFFLQNESVPFINQEISLKRIAEDNYCQAGDLVIADASEDLGDVGKCIEIIELNNEQVLAGLHTMLARPDLSQIAIGFGAFLLKYTDARKQIEKVAQGTKVVSISATRLSGIRLKLPSKKEQTKIATFLSTLDERLGQYGRQIAFTENWKKGLMQRMFV